VKGTLHDDVGCNYRILIIPHISRRAISGLFHSGLMVPEKYIEVSLYISI